MRIILDQFEKGYVNQIAREYNIAPQAVFAIWHSCISNNFEQDLIDLAKEEQDWARKDYGEYDPAKNL